MPEIEGKIHSDQSVRELMELFDSIGAEDSTVGTVLDDIVKFLVGLERRVAELESNTKSVLGGK